MVYRIIVERYILTFYEVVTAFCRVYTHRATNIIMRLLFEWQFIVINYYGIDTLEMGYLHSSI